MIDGGRFFIRPATLAALAAGLLLFPPPAAHAQALTAQALNPCDLNADKVVNILDVQWVVNMALNPSSCTANIVSAGVCNYDVYQRVIRAALYGQCATVAWHSVDLNWTASSSSNVTGYHVYRGTQSSGPYSKLTATPINGTTYTDLAVVSGVTYYYVTTAVDNTNAESVYSNQATAVVPSP